MTQETHVPNPLEELEEAAQGHDLFRGPGRHVMFEEARAEAETANWMPSQVADDWPSADTRRQITERRLDLYEAMQRLEAANARAVGRPRWAEEIREALMNLDAAVHRHVAEIETEGGLFSEVRARAPHLSPVIDDLSREHDEMQERCRAALRVVDAAEIDTIELKRKVLGILGRIASHRQSGAELLYDAYNIDLAAGD